MTGDMLKPEFKDRMHRMLRSESEAFFASYEHKPYKALRLNPLRFSSAPEICGTLGLTEQVPWEPCGYYYDDGERLPGKHPYHAAGVYYIQEPSAMAPVSYLDLHEGERVLDLCAAPGGKSTQIAAYLAGSGLLVSNEIHPARAKILSENIERMGVPNAIVTNETPQRLALRFSHWFDKILVDAPCSGEGMFRKDPEAITEWSPENVEMCAARQEEILASADEMLRTGGRLVYSTCTFSPDEDEGVIERFLKSHEEYRLADLKLYPGMEQGMIEGSIRLYPHKVKGEGHFLAVLVKGEEIPSPDPEDPAGGRRIPPCGIQSSLSVKEIDPFFTFMKQHVLTPPEMSGLIFHRFGEHLYALPPLSPDLKGLKTVRPGLELGTFLKNRFEPAHALSHVLKMTEAVNCIDLPADSPKVRDFLNGQVLRPAADPGTKPAGSKAERSAKICIRDEKAPWTLICVDGFSLGWGKNSSGAFKNHYPKGLRIPI